MDTISPVADAGARQSQVRMQDTNVVMPKQGPAAEGITEATLRLVQSTMTNPDVGTTINLTV
ncbi:MAG TPA: hypothetical protein PLD73_17330 [Candidatus Hydrogenedentes bacterium]|jgi:hypothetical protein|nr:hypothetical protein [Candidatus Hydrogenedentota bacterium]